MTSILSSLKPKDEISTINYEELESKYDIHKYYPKFFHNDGAATPDIKQMIGEKPIYSRANEHVAGWVNPGIKKVYETELDYSSGKLKINKQYEEDGTYKDRKALRREARHDRHEAALDRKEARLEKHEAKIVDKQEKLRKKREKLENKRRLEERKMKIQSKEKPVAGIYFNNPFEATSNNEYVTIGVNPAIHHANNKRNNSISSKLMNLISNNSDDLDIVRTNSFDQTKSQLTSSRKKSLFRKRLSDQIGTYNSNQRNQ